MNLISNSNWYDEPMTMRYRIVIYDRGQDPQRPGQFVCWDETTEGRSNGHYSDSPEDVAKVFAERVERATAYHVWQTKEEDNE